MGVANRWADPAGSIKRPPRVKYRIRDVATGEVVVRLTSVSPDSAVRRGHYFHSLDQEDLHLARRAASLAQRACTYFYAPDGEWEPLTGVDDVVVTDDEVRARIERMELGENAREADRVQRKRYPLSELPWDQQRALVEQLTALYREWQFEWVGEATPEEEAAYQRLRYLPHEHYQPQLTG